MAERKFRYALLGYFDKAYLKRTGKRHILNKYKAEWAADAMVESYGIDLCKQLVDRYMTIAEVPTWNWFVGNSEKILKNWQDEQEDQEQRQRNREKLRMLFDE
jgi:hypothetical protein